MSPDLSVVVPVYKVEPYLHQCLNSLIEQKKRDRGHRNRRWISG